MKTKILAGLLLAASALSAAPRVAISLGFGVPAPRYYAPAPVYYAPAPVYAAPAPVYAPAYAAPGPGYTWVGGYWYGYGPRRVWRPGYWAAPRAHYYRYRR
jgi:hypothetical protein